MAPSCKLKLARFSEAENQSWSPSVAKSLVERGVPGDILLDHTVNVLHKFLKQLTAWARAK